MTPQVRALYQSIYPEGWPANAAFLGNDGLTCGRPEPMRLAIDSPVGVAEDDQVEDSVQAGSSIFDLTGSVAEWTSDGFPIRTGVGRLPWFCIGRVEQDPASGAPRCPETPPQSPQDNIACVWAQYDPNDLEATVGPILFSNPTISAELPYGIYPVCVIGVTGRFSGTEGSLVGGSWLDEGAVAPESAGTFSRRIEPSTDEITDSTRGRQYGLRCVDDREAGRNDSNEFFPWATRPTGGDPGDFGFRIDPDFQPN
ncbi:MAG: hypothetical protein HC923_02030 [Myxococcales bacterium]|nr:hypothetical protein [Myxococcales bacterium]